MPHRVLVVDADQKTLAESSSVLRDAGYLVTCCSRFVEAKRRLLFVPPDLLVADARLGEYNGLHLVYRARMIQPQLLAIITSADPDDALQAEARRANACYLVKPLDPAMFLSTVRRLLAGYPTDPGTEAERRWPRKDAWIDARLDETEVRVTDLSYGGLRLEVPHPDDAQLCSAEHISVAGIGSLAVRLVWLRKVELTGSAYCGVELLAGGGQPAAAEWRGYVDSFPG